MMMGVWYLIPFLCPRVFYDDYKAKRQQRKWDKENLQIPNPGKLAKMIQRIMNIEWDYNYYQPWSDNEWLVDEMLAMLDEDIIMQ